MGVTRPTLKDLGGLITAGKNRAVYFLMIALPMFLWGDSALAQGAPTGGLYTYSKQVSTRIDDTPQTVNYIAFVLGAVLLALGISEMRKYVEGAGQIALKQPLIKLGFGGLFLVFPYIAGIMFDTMLLDADFFDLKKSNAFLFKSTGSMINNQGISGLIAKGINNSMVFINIAGFAGFLIATFLTMRGIQMLRAHMENPGQNPLPEAIKRLGVGGILFALPVAVNIVVKTFGATATAMTNTGYTVTETSGNGGLDGMMVNFIRDISNPAFLGIEVFCYISGILMILFAMQRLVRTSQDGPRGPLGFGTIMMFIVAALLLSFPQFLTTIDTSLTGSGGKALTQVSFMSELGSGEETKQAKNVFSAVLAFMAVIGFLSVVRGLFLLKSFADGNQQATMMSVVTHIVAGSMAINLGFFINAVQKSLGVTNIPVTFG